MIVLTFVLLGLSIVLVWVPVFRIASVGAVPPWAIAFIAAVIAGLLSGILGWSALVSLGALAALSYFAQILKHPVARALLTVLATLVALALALHLAPGFNNPIIADRIRLTPDAIPYTRYANFDKGAAGLFILAFFCQRVASWREFGQVIRVGLLAAVATGAVLMLASYGVGYVRFDPKIPTIALAWLGINLLFVCVAEEAFFRGLIQDVVAKALRPTPAPAWIAVALSAMLFGLAHYAGGASYVLLAMIGGLGYAIAYHVTGRIEAPIVAHFGVNALHFFGFTYPQLQQ